MNISSSPQRLSLLTITVCIVAAAWILVAEPTGPWVALSVLLPAIAGTLVVFTLVKTIRQMDELQRSIHLEAFAISFGVLALLTFVQLGLDQIGQPVAIDPGLFLLLLEGLWIASYLWAKRRYQ
jgi:hypothetical protein